MKGGTPVGSASMCRTCSNAQIMNGYRESEVIVVCKNTYPNVAVPFTVRECTGFNDKNRPNWKQMQSLAINVAPVRISKRVGFRSELGETHTGDPECAEEDDE
jgi:hypothetical protein